MTTNKPLDAGGWFVVHNYVFDLCMPRLSPSAWKILCVAIRQTWGWRAEEDPTGEKRREWDRLSYSQFREKAGIRSDATVRRALQECIDAGYIVRKQEGWVSGKGLPTYTYSLNRGYDISTETVAGNPATENEAAPATENEAAPATDSVDTKRKVKDKKDSASAALTAEEKEAFDLLMTLQLMDPEVARPGVKTMNLEDVPGWVVEGKRIERNDPDLAVKLVMRRLFDRKAPPRSGSAGEQDIRSCVSGIVCPKCWTYPCQCEDDD